MSFRESAKRVREAAATLGLSLHMAKLNHAIAIACFDKKYSAVIAAEKAGTLAVLPSPPPYISKAALAYQLDAHALGLALRLGLQGPPSSDHDGAVATAINWLVANHSAEAERLVNDGLLGVTSESVLEKAYRHARAAVHGAWSDWVIAEGTIGRYRRPVWDLVLADGGPSLTPGQRAYLAALKVAPLRLYLVESVVPGHQIRLRPLSAGSPDTETVDECLGSSPSIQGTLVGARLLDVDGRRVLAGGIYPFSRGARNELLAMVGGLKGQADVSRAIRQQWFGQFEEPSAVPAFVQAVTGDPILLVTDYYRCDDLEAFVERLAQDQTIEGEQRGGWSKLQRCDDGLIRPAYSVSIEPGASSISVFYMTAEEATRWRPQFEAIAGKTIYFLRRETHDTTAILEVDPRGHAGARIPASLLASTADQMYQQVYKNWADKPLPLFDGLTPREMLQQDGGEKRIRDLLALYEGTERRLAAEERRSPVSLRFLYDSLNLSAAQ